MDSSTVTIWTGLFPIAGCWVIFFLLHVSVCFKESPGFNANRVGPDQTPRSVASDLDLHSFCHCPFYWVLGINVIFTQLAFYVNLHRAVIGPSATLTGRWLPDIDLRRMLTGYIHFRKKIIFFSSFTKPDVGNALEERRQVTSHQNEAVLYMTVYMVVWDGMFWISLISKKKTNLLFSFFTILAFSLKCSIIP